MFEKKNQKFDYVHHLFPKFLTSILDKEVTKKFIHISALGANKDSNSSYIRSKFQGEEAVINNFKNSILHGCQGHAELVAICIV